MRVLNSVRLRLRSLFRRQRVDEELDDELRFHLEQEAQALIEQGLAPAEAVRRAHLDLGGLEQVKAECRQARGVHLIETALQDVRYGIRTLRQSPWFAMTALATLALTIGAVSTVLTLANAFMWRPLAVQGSRDLVVVSSHRRHPYWNAFGFISYPDYVDLRDHTTTLDGLAAHYSSSPLWATYGGVRREIVGAVVSANYFRTLGLTPALGRFFSEDDDRVPGRDCVVVISHALWRSAFGSSPEVLGATLWLNRVPFTVVGVAPEGFNGLSMTPNDVYMPTMMLRVGYRYCDVIADSDCTILSLIGRLREGRTLENVQAEMATLTPAHWAANATRKGALTDLVAFRPRGAGGVYGSHSYGGWAEAPLILTVTGLTLLVGCANLGGLLLVRGGARTREIAIRASLGASPGRLLRQLMTESLLLAAAGGVLGLLLSLALTRALEAMFYRSDSEGYIWRFDLHPDPLVIVAVLAIAAGTAFAFGLVPALRSIRLGAAQSLSRQASAPVTHARLTPWLVGIQIAAALTLTISASLLASSARRFVTDANFDPSHVALLRLRPALVEYSAERAQNFQRGAVRRLQAVPGVVAVSLFEAGAVLEGGEVTVSRDGQRTRAIANLIGPAYFAVLGTPVLEGRDFDEHDGVGSPGVAIIDEACARSLGLVHAVGTRLVIEGGPEVEVVGVVANVSTHARAYPPDAHLYTPFWRKPDARDARYCVRVQGDPGAMLPSLVRAVNDVDPDVPVTETLPMTTQLADGALKNVRMTATIVVYAAGLAVLLSAIGVYGTLAFSVACRTKEIGVRTAVGASPASIACMVVGEGMRTVLLGLVAGVACAWAAAQLLRHLLYGATAGDGLLYTASALAVAFVGMCACWIPARRAARLDPRVALNSD
jgi:predicted permease